MTKKSKVEMPCRFYFYKTDEGWFWTDVPYYVTKEQALSETVGIHRKWVQSTSGAFDTE